MTRFLRAAFCCAIALSASGLSAQSLEGFVDMHTHPMSHLAFGGMVVFGAPDVGTLIVKGHRKTEVWGCNGEDRRVESIEEALGDDNAIHGGPGALDNHCGDVIRLALIDELERVYAYETRLPQFLFQVHGHPNEGYPAFRAWPHWSSVTHQQMWVDWIRRAHEEGGLNVMVALAVNNTLLAKAVNAERYVDDRASAKLQLHEMRQMVERHDWMEIAGSPRELRDIVGRGNLAVVLGIETDDFGNLAQRAKAGERIDAAKVRMEIDALHALGVRYILPFHFSNTPLGGYAINSSLFALSSLEYTGNYPSVRDVCGGPIRFRLTTESFGFPQADLLRTRDLGRIIDRQVAHPPPAPGCGHANALGLTALGSAGIEHMMNRGMIIDIDHMSRAAADDVLRIAERRNYPLVSGHNGLASSACTTGTGFDPATDCHENARTPEDYRAIRRLGGMVGLGHGGQATRFVLGYRDMLGRMAGHRVAIGTDVNGLEPLPAPDPRAPVTYRGSLTPYRFHDREWNINTDGFSHYGLFPDWLASLGTGPGAERMTRRERDAFMRSAEDFAQVWEKAELRRNAISRHPALHGHGWCTHAGTTLHVADVNGDSHDDLICRDGGRLWFMFSSPRGSFAPRNEGGFDTRFCTHTGAVLRFADINGDRRDDLVCTDATRVWAILAPADGRWQDRVSFVFDADFCGDAQDNIFVGDIDADGTDDLICKEHNRLRMRFGSLDRPMVRYADARGVTFCSHTGASFSLGDFNGDRRVDMLCKDRERISISYTVANEHTSGWPGTRADVVQETSWCTHDGAKLVIADVNADRVDDLVCIDRARTLWVRATNPNGSLPDHDTATGSAVCDAPPVFGDVNGDAQADFVCRGPRYLSVRYLHHGVPT